jgi:Sigma-70 region 2
VARLLEAFAPLIAAHVRRFGGRGAVDDDLKQVARMALLRAVERFDLARATRLSSYSIPWIASGSPVRINRVMEADAGCACISMRVVLAQQEGDENDEEQSGAGGRDFGSATGEEVGDSRIRKHHLRECGDPKQEHGQAEQDNHYKRALPSGVAGQLLSGRGLAEDPERSADRRYFLRSRALLERVRLPEQRWRISFLTHSGCRVRDRTGKYQQESEQRKQGDPTKLSDGCELHRMVTGVPTGINFASRSMSELRIRIQPWETRPGISCGSLVPWIPTKPPPGQSVSTAERALVPKAMGP